MIEIEEAIIQLDYRKDFATKKQIEAIDLAIETLKQKKWLIEKYEHKIETLEQDMEDEPHRIFYSTQKAVFESVLYDLKGDGED